MAAPEDDDVVTSKNERDASASGLFDLRRLIGGLFGFYGVILVVASFFVGTEKSVGVDINLWLGIGMLAVGAFFLLWAWRRPLRLGGPSARARAERPERPGNPRPERPGNPEHGDEGHLDGTRGDGDRRRPDGPPM